MPPKKRKGSQSQNKTDQSRTEVLNESVRNKSVRETEVEESMDCEEGNDLETSFTAADSIPTSGHSRLLNGLETPEKFIQLIDAHRSKKDDFDLEEVIPILTSDEQNAMWSRLANFVKTACEHLSQENSFANQPEAENNLEEISTNVLSGVALVCRLCLGLEDVINSPSQYLRETLNHFSTHILHVKHQIGDAFSRCIELWYTSSMEDREDLALSSLKFLLKKIIVEKSGAKNDVKRVWSLHQILLSLRLEECGLKEDLLSCFSSSLFLTTQPEGIKFLAHLFTLSVQFTQDICKQIKQSLITLTAKQSYNLGEVYMKAWAQSGGAFRTLLEDNLQKLMDEGMLVNRVKHLNLAKNVASFLHCFHDNKQNSELKTLLANLYAPFIWRYIKCSNMNVRQNALDIFLSAYPIENLSLSKQEREAEIDKQNLLLRNLLMDSVVEIRSRTLVGLGRILANYWLLLSSETINSFMEPIIKELAFDSVSKVRVRVYECIKSILDTSYSHVYMKEILPKLKLGLHDTNESVRVAFVDLLLAVKSIKIIRYWDICPLENLLAQMELDKPVVANAIAKLLIPSIFPKDGTTEDLLNRAIKLQQTNKKAARKFYFIVPAMVEKERLIELVYAILDSVRHYLRSKNSDKENMGASGKKKKKLYNKSVLDESAESTMDSTSTSSIASTVIASESESRIQEDHLYNDMELVGGLLDSVCVLWYNLNQELAEEQNKNYRLYLEQKVAKSILTFFKHYRDTSISSTIVYLASFLSHSSASHVASYSLSQLKKNNKFQVHAEALVNWRRGDEVLELLIEWVRKEVDSPTPVRPNHGVQFREPDTDKPSLQKTINMANFILDNETTRMILLKKNMAQIIELTQSTAQVLNLIQDKMGEDVDISEQRIEDYSSLVGLHFKLNVVLGLQKKYLIEKFEDLISWVDVQLVPVILREQPCSFSSLRLAERCTEEVLAVLEGVLLTGQVDEKFLKRVLDFLLQIIPNLNLADHILDIQREIANLCFNNEFLELFDEVVPVNFVNLLKVYSQKGDKLEPDQTKVIKSKILKFIRLYLKISKLDSSTKDALKDLVETVSLAVFQAADLELQKTDTLVLMDRFNNIEQEKPCLEILRSATVHNLISILEDNIAFTKIFHQVITEAIPEKEEFKMLFIYLCLLANMPQQTREKFLESIKTRIEKLSDKESEELEEYEEECTQVLNILAL